MVDEQDTIAAISTPTGEGGIGIIRLSGEKAENIGKQVLRTTSGSVWENFEERRVYFGKVVNQENQVIDEAIFFLFREPRSYTKENLLEIQLHGNAVILEEVLNILLIHGARLAEPGEFTRRAFMNGRIDLAQAEAIIDLIRARTTRGGKVAANILTGDLHNKVIGLKKRLLSIIAEIEASLDYPEEEIDLSHTKKRIKELEKIESDINNMLDKGVIGQILQEGITVVLTGRPNVGKSSILNALLQQERAIVTDIPGTTRDILVEELDIYGVPVKIVDTAGIHESENLVERLGIERAREWIDRADLILLVIEAGKSLNVEDEQLIQMVKEKKLLVVANKTDQSAEICTEELKARFSDRTVIYISALNRQGLDQLEKAIFNAIDVAIFEPDHEVLLTRTRHRVALQGCVEAIHSAVLDLENGVSDDLAVIALRTALQSLLSITGEDVNDSIIEEIFNSFCLGK